MTPTASRARFLAAIAALPDEAMGYLVDAAIPNAEPPFHSTIWPDGIGGFSGASRAAITEVHAAATAYLDDARRA